MKPITRRVWDSRLMLLGACIGCTIFNVHAFVTGVALGMLTFNLIVFNPWSLAKAQRREDEELARDSSSNA
jgi:hypothetical protein